MQKAFLLTQDTPSPVEQDNFKAKGVNVLSITPSIAQDVIGNLKLDPHPDHFLGEHGRTLVNQLVILRDYRESCQLIDFLLISLILK